MYAVYMYYSNSIEYTLFLSPNNLLQHTTYIIRQYRSYCAEAKGLKYGAWKWCLGDLRLGPSDEDKDKSSDDGWCDKYICLGDSWT